MTEQAYRMAGVDYCPHGWDDHLWRDRCSDCRMVRIEVLLVRIADSLDHADDTIGRAAALEEWRTGNGRHPDD